MSCPEGPRNPLWRHGRGTVLEIARQMIRDGHGLRGRDLEEWYDRVRELALERLPVANPLRDLIERRYAMSRNLDDLRPEVRPMVDAFLADCEADDIDILVTCTLRSMAEQTALYAQGRTTPGKIVTNAKPGQSAHNFGLAIDVVPIVNGKPDWDGTHPVWHQVGALGQLRGLRWLGAPDSPFKEEAHFEAPNWRSLADLTT